MSVRGAHFILYVRDQEAATRFYRAVLGIDPTLDVPGMTEFSLGPGAVLGLMPDAGIVRLLGIDPAANAETSRAEVYLLVDDPAAYHARALAAGATELSALAVRSWGDRVAYSRDLDGAVVAFAVR